MQQHWCSKYRSKNGYRTVLSIVRNWIFEWLYIESHSKGYVSYSRFLARNIHLVTIGSTAQRLRNYKRDWPDIPSIDFWTSTCMRENYKPEEGSLFCMSLQIWFIVLRVTQELMVPISTCACVTCMRHHVYCSSRLYIIFMRCPPLFIACTPHVAFVTDALRTHGGSVFLEIQVDVRVCPQ